MHTIAIAELKAHLSAELKKVRSGQTLLILDHRQPVARIVPLSSGISYKHKASRPPHWQEYTPLVRHDPLTALEAERADSW
ncbi:MAG: type II toxin-antitoxin system Phd/YefM family antitoxin [Spirochaetes bacterium]|nr:type II toxin-antitoxin system Phd/YefM family antitoxin [Spirochaetota bacterium]MBU0955940.1 type II toxin-antitoxin system Phd/YefM family antitoxin [Spirochaetota bacterium]